MFISVLKYNGNWNEFFEHIVKGNATIRGAQYDWLLDWDQNKSKGDMLFVKYEGLKQDTACEIRKIAAFLDIKLTDTLLQRILRDVDIKQMKEDKATEGWSHIRSGQCGEWKKYFTVEQNEWFDNKYKKLFEELDIDIDYD